MEASALQAPATLPQTRAMVSTPLLRFRSDEQLVALFRAGHDDAFRAIHERYHRRLFAYARQMLPGRQDAEDALQDVFVRAYAGLRASDQELALRAWLFRVAHNRCIDELRRPAPPPPEVLQLVRTTVHDPLAEVDLRESLRRLIEDIRRLPDQQRSALLMRELAGMPYADLATSLGISIGAVKSLLVRARVALAQAAEARDTSCLLIREQLVEAHDRGLRPNATTRKHMRDCVGCKSFRRELRGMSRQLAAVAPAVGPLGLLAKTLGFSGGAGGGAAGGGGLAILGGSGATASAGGLAVGVNHVATLLVAAVATAGGAVELQHTIIAPTPHPLHAAAPVRHHGHGAHKVTAVAPATGIQTIAGAVEATVSSAPKLAATADPPVTIPLKAKLRRKASAGGAGLTASTSTSALSRSSTTNKTSTAAGTTAGSVAGTGASSCSSGASPDSSQTSSAHSSSTTDSTPSTSSSPQSSSAAGPSGSTTSSQSVCAPSSVSSSATVSPSTSGTSSTSNSSSNPGGSTSGASSSSSTSQPNSESSSTGTASTGGSAAPSK